MNNLMTPSFDKKNETALNAGFASDELVAGVVPVMHEEQSSEPTMDDLLKAYSRQDRECWLCDGIAKKLSENIALSDDDTWHFTSCVMSWEHIHRLSE